MSWAGGRSASRGSPDGSPAPPTGTTQPRAGPATREDRPGAVGRRQPTAGAPSAPRRLSAPGTRGGWSPGDRRETRSDGRLAVANPGGCMTQATHHRQYGLVGVARRQVLVSPQWPTGTQVR